MKIRNLVFATVGAASLALVLSACNEPAANNSANNTKPVNVSTPVAVNTATPANVTPINTNHGANNTANTKPIDNKANTNMATPKKP